MTTDNFDVVVCGNGALGVVTALVVAWDHPELTVALVGPGSRQWSASTAAGAMIAVIAEVEDAISDVSGFHADALRLGLRSTDKWRDLLARAGANHTVSATDTVVYLQDESSDFEHRNFEAVRDAASQAGRIEFLSESETQRLFSRGEQSAPKAIQIKGEYAVDPEPLFARLGEALTAAGVCVIDGLIDRVIPEAQRVTTSDGLQLGADRIVLAMGAQTHTVLASQGMQPMLQGVGTALLVGVPSSDLMPELGERVVRSVNRGGAQCGIHLLPRKGGQTYIGAGNYVAAPGAPDIRFETVRYLLDVAERDLIGREAGYAAKGSLLLGNRPRSLDGLPLIGPLDSHPHVYVATATNRLGLTWAPSIGEWVSSWISGDSATIAPSSWAPERQPVPFGPAEHCYTYFVESRLGNALEHGLVKRHSEAEDRMRLELEHVARNQEATLRSKVQLVGDLLPSPDVWNYLIQRSDGDVVTLGPES